MNATAVMLSKKSFTAVVNDVSYTMDSNNPNWNRVMELYKKKDWESIIPLFNPINAVKEFGKFTGGKIEIKGNMVTYDGETLHNVVVNTILTFAKEGQPYLYLVKFLEKLMLNPSRRAVAELYTFLEHGNMPITEEGNFIAYKSVKPDFKDWHSGKFDNSPGASPEMRRNQVDDDARKACSNGLHCGSLSYAETFGGSDRVIVLVEIDPRDVVSVPIDENCRKMRCCKYKVLSVAEGAIHSSVYNTKENLEVDDDNDYLPDFEYINDD